MVDFEALERDVASYYEDKLRDHGPTARGVDWKNEADQKLRFRQLCKLLPVGEGFTVNDLGCGYGALYSFLVERGYKVSSYYGYDVSRLMIEEAHRLFGDFSQVVLINGNSKQLKQADYTLASGLFNVKGNCQDELWLRYVLEVLRDVDRASRRGFAFNLLTRYSDPEKMRNDLFYAHPGFFFDYCKQMFSRNVALLHDYGLYEFTLIVRKG
jgi:SAM-dependent methyltransferase